MCTQIMKPHALVLALVALVSFAQPAHAYNAGTHQEIVDAAWGAMVASQDPALTTGRGLYGNLEQAPKSLRLADTPVSQEQWNLFLSEIRAAILALNRMPSGLQPSTKSICTNITPLSPLGTIKVRISSGYAGTHSVFRGDDNDGNKCSTEAFRAGVFGAIGQGSPVIGAVPGLAGEFGGTETQGLVLGWHSKAGDDCIEDIVLNVNLGQIILNLPIPGLGGLTLEDAVTLGIAVVALPVLCFISLLGGGDCSMDSAREFAQDVNPVTAIAGLIPPFDFNITSGDYTGMPHFINALGSPGGSANRFDDRRGLFYESAGPTGTPGAVDQVIATLFDRFGVVIDADSNELSLHALMTDRYDLGTGVGDGHPERRSKRSSWTWNRETAAHTQMTPLDNFAHYGWSEFKNDPQRSVSYLRWPLHALGDATVPMHVAPTSAWGHRAYEDAFDDSLNKIRPQDPEDELAQMRRILQEAFTVREFIKARRIELGRPNDTPVRDLITQLARDTLETVEREGGNWYCDACSTTYAASFKETATSAYLSDHHLVRMTKMFEKSAAYTLAFLMSAAEQPILERVCSETSEACSDDRPCCVGECGSNGTCAAPPRPTAPFACDENGQCAHGECVNDYCPGGTECNRNDQCPSGNCLNGFCGEACATAADCPTNGCENGRCCIPDSNECSNAADCCGGTCRLGLCRRSPGGEGDACGEDSDCIRGACVSGQCSSSCNADLQCAELQVCEQSSCCIPSNGECVTPSDCCSSLSVCIELGGRNAAGVRYKQCVTPLGPGAGTCITSSMCLRGRCENGICQSDCSDGVSCAVGVCESGQCCVSDGGVCFQESDCCSRSRCEHNRCVPPPDPR
jgi:hypothetical protein